MIRPHAAVFALVLAAAASQALAQPAPTAPALDAATRKAVVEQAAKALREQYVYPGVGENAAARITAELQGGRYDQIADPVAFADRLTADLQGISHDKHMRVMARGGPPPAGVRPGPPVRSEFGVVRADRLEGGVGYVEVNGFPPLALFKPVADRAMAAVADAPALIIDLRRNHGGEPEAVAYLVSFFLDPAQRTHINDIVERRSGTADFNTTAYWSMPTPTRYLGRPVYVLTSGETFSGGEEFAYDMQTETRAVLVGETTGGGANPGGMTRLTPTMAIFVPNGRAENPVTKTNWEGKGVVPAVSVPRDEALKAALQRLGVAAAQAPDAKADVDVWSRAALVRPRMAAQPGSEAALRRSLDEIARGAPNYDEMLPEMAQVTRDQLPDLKSTLAGLGALQSVTFREVDPQGADIYDVRFSGGVLRWAIVLTPDGKLAMEAFRPA